MRYYNSMTIIIITVGGTLAIIGSAGFRTLSRSTFRIVSGARKYDHVTPHLKSLSWLPVKDQLYYRQAIMAFKCISGHAPKYLTSQFITREQVTKRTTRSSQKLNILFLKQPQDKEHFIIELLDFGII